MVSFIHGRRECRDDRFHGAVYGASESAGREPDYGYGDERESDGDGDAFGGIFRLFSDRPFAFSYSATTKMAFWLWRGAFRRTGPDIS